MTDAQARLKADTLAEHWERQCNRHINGECHSRRCLVRGGWKTGPVDYSLATCEERETATLLRTPDAQPSSEQVASLAWLLRRNLEDEDRRMAVENCNRLICLLETGDTPDDMDTLRAIYKTISARLADGSGESGSETPCERMALLGDAQPSSTACPTCEGRGVYDSHPIPPDTGPAMEFECYTCNGTGRVEQPSSTEPCPCVDFQRYVENCPEHGFVAHRNETAPSSTDEVERVATALQSVQPYALSWSSAQSLARAAIAAMVTK